MRRAIPFVLPFLALLACGPRYQWVKNVSPEQARMDAYECERDMRAGANSFGTGIISRQMNADEFQARCFQAKGYTLQPIAEEPGNDRYRNNLRLCEQSCAANNLGPLCYERCRANWDK